MSDAELSDLIDALARTPERLRVTITAQIANFSEEQLRKRRADDEFSAVETICHLRDIEVEGYTVRINRLLNEELPSLPDIDGARLAVERHYNSQNIQQALDAFRQARIQNVRILRGLAPEQLGRAGTLEGVGDVTLERLLLMMREHDEDHLQTTPFSDASESRGEAIQ